MKNIILIQHTEAEHHVTKMIGGNTDWPLTEYGIEQANNIGKKLKSELNCEYIIYCSDLLRTKQTALNVNKYLNFEIIYKNALQEINVGEAKGKSSQWYHENKAPNQNDDKVNYKPFPNAESTNDVYNRIKSFVNEIINNDQENIIIVGHGYSLRVLIMVWLNIPIEKIEEIAFFGSAGGVSFIKEKDNARILETWNNKKYVI